MRVYRWSAFIFRQVAHVKVTSAWPSGQVSLARHCNVIRWSLFHTICWCFWCCDWLVCVYIKDFSNSHLVFKRVFYNCGNVTVVLVTWVLHNYGFLYINYRLGVRVWKPSNIDFYIELSYFYNWLGWLIGELNYYKLDFKTKTNCPVLSAIV